MKFTPSTALGLALFGWLSGCSEHETTLSISVRYWTDYLDPSTFEVTIEQEGKNAIVSDFAPRQLNGGDYDVVCEDDWRPNYCRFFQRFEVPGWSAKETTVTLQAGTLEGSDTFNETETIELVENEINVVYFELEGVVPPNEPEPPLMDAGVDSGVVDSGGADSGGADSGGADSGGADSGGADSGGADDGGTDVDGGDVDGGDDDGNNADGGEVDGGDAAGAPDAGDAETPNPTDASADAAPDAG